MRDRGQLSEAVSARRIISLGLTLGVTLLALLAMADEAEVADTTAELTRLGGRAQANPVAPEAVAQAEQALSAAAASTETPPDSSSGNE